MSEVIIKWTVDDLLTIRRYMPRPEAEKIFARISRPLKDRSIDEGWAILKTLVEIAEKK
jgi:hypothetical protein